MGAHFHIRDAATGLQRIVKRSVWPTVFSVASTQHLGPREKGQNRVSLVDKRTCKFYSLLPSSVHPLNFRRVFA